MIDDKVLDLIEKDVFEFDEVSRFAGAGFTDNIQNMLSREKSSPGIKITEEDDHIIVNLEIIVYFGVNIPQLCYDIQTRVKNDLESNAELNVKAVNIRVEGLDKPSDMLS